MKNFISLILIANLLSQGAFAAKIQQQGIKTAAECIAAGATAATCLPLDSQVYDSTNAQQLSVSIANGQLGGSGGSSGIELLPNPNFETGSAVSSGYTISDATASLVTTTGTGLLFGKKTAKWQPTVINQTFASSALAIAGLAGGNCAASLYYTYAGTAGDYVLKAIDGSSNVLGSLALPVSSNASVPTVITFPCGSTAASTLKWQLSNTVSTPSAIFFDNNHLGSLGTQQTSQTISYGKITYPNSIGSRWTSTNTGSFANYTALTTGTNPTITGNAVMPGAAAQIPGITFASLPPGHYVVHTVMTSDALGAGNQCSYQVSDGTTARGMISNAVSGYTASGTPRSIIPSVTEASYDYTTAQSNITFQVQDQGNTGGGCNVDFGLGGNADFIMEVIYYPTSSQQSLPTDQAAASWAGSTSYSSSVTSASFADFSNSTDTLTETRNRNFGTVSALTNLPGIVFTPPKTGRYFVCANTFLQANTTASAYSTLQIYDGTNSIAEAGVRNPAGGGIGELSLPLCGVLDVPSIVSTTLKIRGKASSGSVSIYNGNQRGAVEWSIFQLDAGQPAPLLVGAVTSTTTGLEHIERAYFTPKCTSSPCAITSGTPGITSVTRSTTGTYSVNFSASAFSSTPSCSVGGYNLGTSNGNCQLESAGSSSAQAVTCRAYATGTTQDDAFSIQCMGPH